MRGSAGVERTHHRRGALDVRLAWGLIAAAVIAGLLALGPPPRPAVLRHAIAPGYTTAPRIILLPDADPDTKEGRGVGLVVPAGTRCTVLGHDVSYTRIQFDGRTWLVRTAEVELLDVSPTAGEGKRGRR